MRERAKDRVKFQHKEGGKRLLCTVKDRMWHQGMLGKNGMKRRKMKWKRKLYKEGCRWAWPTG